MLKVLQEQAQIDAARREMSRRGIGYWPERPHRSLLDRILRRRRIEVGDPRKSWDVLETVQLVEARLPLDAPIVDLGAYASEILLCLHRAGYRNLSGIDLDPAIARMPCAEAIRYRVGDMMATGLPAGTLGAVTAISAIEHGVDLEALVREVSRVLAPGGLFIASTDYWPDKIDTSGIRMYDLPWTIFSRPEIESFFALAAAHGLRGLGERSFAASERPIEAAEKRYTFAWFALEKERRP